MYDINNKNENSKFADSDIFEGIISFRAVTESIETRNSNRKILKVLFAEENKKGNGKLLGYLKAKSYVHGFTLETVPLSYIDSICSGNSHGGIVFICSVRKYTAIPREHTDSGFFALLEGIEDPYNFGYAIRSLYAAGADAVLLPKRNWLGAAGIVCRASAGTSELIDCFVSDDIPSDIAFLQSKGFRLVCSDSKASLPAHKANLKKPLILAVGGEKRGFSKSVTQLSDLNVRLQYGRDFPHALSAASAAAILAFEVTKQNLTVQPDCDE